MLLLAWSAHIHHRTSCISSHHLHGILLDLLAMKCFIIKHAYFMEINLTAGCSMLFGIAVYLAHLHFSVYGIPLAGRATRAVFVH